MKKLLHFVVISVLATALTVILGLTAASADSESGKFRWIAASGMTVFGFSCLGPPPCPDAAVAENGHMIEITGEGTLRIHEGKPERVRGTGSYRHTDSLGDLVDVGTWTARKLLSFEDFGPSTSLPANWRQGRALIRIHMVSQSGDMEAIATLELGCRLPNPVTPAPPDAIEGIRLNVKGGPNFVIAIDPRSTLFIQISDDDDDDDDDDD